MNLNKFDMVVLVVMPLAIIGMSFTMPALGLGSSDVSENDIPQFDIDADRFDFVGDFPESPADGSSGTLTFDTETPSEGERAVFLNDTVELALADYQPYGEAPVQVRLTDLAGSDVDPVALEEPGDSSLLSVRDGEWEVEVELTRTHTEGTSEVIFIVQYEVISSSDEQPSGFIESLFWSTPLGKYISGVIQNHGPLEGIAATLLYMYNIMRWFSGTLNEIIWNFTYAFADLSLFFINLVTWLFTTYSDLITGAPSWAAIFVSIPGILLSVVLGKLTFVLVSMLPTT